MSPEEVVGSISADILQRMPMPWKVKVCSGWSSKVTI